MKTKAIGAIVGDTVGSIYEFNNHKSKEFPLFGEGCSITDDSILTVATMGALLKGASYDDFVDSYIKYARKYPAPMGGYGVWFLRWVSSDFPEPYNSWGNGSAMRVSPVAWFYDDLEEVERVAKISAEVTHNHAEAIKGAQAVAGAIFLARKGKTKQEIKDYIEKTYDYFLDFKLEDIRSAYTFDVSCSGTVPPAIVAFLESVDFEDAIRSAVSVGGDSDTLTAITGSIAEVFYGVPSDIEEKTLEFLPEDLKGIVEEFNSKIG